jgi:ribosome-binding protein aMBF1 (putative translation factor)
MKGRAVSTKTSERKTVRLAGEPVARAGRRRARGAEYRGERARLAPSEAIARQVIMRRGELGLTQRELADRIGTSHSAISRLESGQHRASITTLERVGEALGLRLVVSFEPAVGKTSVPTA